MIRYAGIDFTKLPESNFDAHWHRIRCQRNFGATGGVMEAALRTVYEIVTKGKLWKILILKQSVVLKVSKEAEVKIGDTIVAVAVAHGLGNARENHGGCENQGKSPVSFY